MRPSTGVGIINSGVNIPEIDFAHEAIDLWENGINTKRKETKKKLTLNWREKLAKRD